jgi:multimeric flavodoxin WrbA
VKVVAFNGSPKKEGNTYHAIKLVADELEKEGIEVEIVHVGNKTIRGCFGCNACFKIGKCVYEKDEVNEWIEKMKTADGILIGSPVHYSGVAGTMKSFLDRAFYVASSGFLRHKVGAAVVAVRRSGGVTTFNQLNHYLTYSEMVIPATNYWNIIHGTTPGEALQDEEGKQIMRVLGKNMAWLMKLVEQGKNSVTETERERKILTNFIR